MNNHAMIFLDNFSILLENFSENEALEFATKEAHFTIRKKLEKSLHLLENGYTLDECLKNTGLFPEFFTESLKSAMSSGNTREVVTKFVSKFKEDKQIDRTLKVMMFIPKIQLIACLFILCYSSQKILPTYMFLIKGKTIPWQTKLLLNAGSFLSTYYSNLLSTATVVFAIWIFYKQTKLHHNLKDMLLSFTFNRFYKIRIIERFSYILSLLLESGMDLEKSLRLSASFVDAPHFLKDYNKMIQMIENGHFLSHSAKKLFDDKFISLIELGEKTEDLTGCLKKCNSMALEYRRKEEEKIVSLVQNICPILIASMIMLIVVGVGLPIMTYVVYI